MNKFLVLALLSLFPILSFGQTQIGTTIYGVLHLEEFGYSTVISGDGTVMAVGAPENSQGGSNQGSVRVFKNISGTWTQIGAKIQGIQANEHFGCSVALSDDGSVIAIGAEYNNGPFGVTAYPGAVRVYKNVSGVWIQVGSSIIGGDTFAKSGTSVSLSADGSILAVGAPGVYNNNALAGEVKIYKNISDVWTPIGNSIKGIAYGTRLGTSVSLSNNGNRVAIGTYLDNNAYTLYRFAQVYENIAGVWTQLGTNILGEDLDGRFGWSVAISGDGTKVAVGDPANGISDAGSTRIYQYNSGTGFWQKIGQDIDGVVSEERNSGNSVSLSDDGNILAIGAYYGGTTDTYGTAKIYKNTAGTWTKIGTTIQGLGDSNRNGYSVSLSGDAKILGVGALSNNGPITTGYARAYDLTPIVLDTKELIMETEVKIYPNPVKDKLNITASKKINSLSVYDMLGQEVLSKKVNAKETSLEVSHLVSGIYLLKIASENKTKNIKITKD